MKPPDDFDSVKLNRGGFALSFRDLRYEGMVTPPALLGQNLWHHYV
ncbi:MAG TPA: hypothetical protein VK885_03320 [Desulfotignum sp.]|jgi:hypothetical protein|nr:hypothetical protein [Desulfotignum sp.]